MPGLAIAAFAAWTGSVADTLSDFSFVASPIDDVQQRVVELRVSGAVLPEDVRRVTLVFFAVAVVIGTSVTGLKIV